jgi:hypothetical protein
MRDVWAQRAEKHQGHCGPRVGSRTWVSFSRLAALSFSSAEDTTYPCTAPEGSEALAVHLQPPRAHLIGPT